MEMNLLHIAVFRLTTCGKTFFRSRMWQFVLKYQVFLDVTWCPQRVAPKNDLQQTFVKTSNLAYFIMFWRFPNTSGNVTGWSDGAGKGESLNYQK